MNMAKRLDRIVHELQDLVMASRTASIDELRKCDMVISTIVEFAKDIEGAVNAAWPADTLKP
jgi:hypothetical protein